MDAPRCRTNIGRSDSHISRCHQTAIVMQHLLHKVRRALPTKHCAQGWNTQACLDDVWQMRMSPNKRLRRRSTVGVVLMRDVQGSAMAKLAMLQEIRAAGGFANEDPADLRDAEKTLHKLAIREKRQSLRRRPHSA